MLSSELKQSIDSGNISGAFLFCGEEGYLKRYFRDYLCHAIGADGDFSEFNYITFDGPNVDMSELYEAIRSVPMMADRKMVVWSKVPLDSLKSTAAELLNEMCREVKTEYDYTTLVLIAEAQDFDCGTEKRPSKSFLSWSQRLCCVNFEKSTEARLLSWLQKHFSAEGITATQTVCRHMLERCGHSMEDLLHEQDKVSCYVHMHGKKTVTEQDIDYTTVAHAENDAFALTNALMKGNINIAFSMLDDLRRRRAEPQMVMGQIARFYCDLLSQATLMADGMTYQSAAAALKMNEYKASLYAQAIRRMGGVTKLERAIKFCTETDLIIKSIYDDPWTQIEKLIVRLCT